MPVDGPVRLEIADASGRVVRRYSRADRPRAFDPSKTRVAPEWFRTPSTLATTPGMHRFVWPLHYPPPEVLAKGTPRSTTRWLFLRQTLDDLSRAIEGADAAPTPDARAGLAKARQALARIRDAQARLEEEVNGSR